MTTKQMAEGGITLALFIVISMIFLADARMAQGILEIIKVFIIASYCHAHRLKSNLAFFVAAVLLSVILLPLQVALVYNISSAVQGLVLGVLLRYKENLLHFLIFFVVNLMMYLYELFMYTVLSEENLFLLYLSDTGVFLKNISSDRPFLSWMVRYARLFTGISVFFSAFFGSLILYLFVGKITKKVR